MSTKAKIIIVVVLIVVAAIVYYLFFNKKDENTIVDEKGNITTPDTTKPVTVQNDNFPLEIGMQGKNIARLQTALNFIKPTNPVLVDGIFGSKTTAKLYTTVSTALSKQPITEQQFNQIIALGNRTQLGL